MNIGVISDLHIDRHQKLEPKRLFTSIGQSDNNSRVRLTVNCW
ncbi:Uncharacterised protein [Staphylococcus gallinarum]|uniref:Uncharacterized protein n=1 Tax=Staphylococcus gallinarum TaxID=1293 RepID=A0A380FLF1_STAGA|nr:Uncharacterised protein [Staphylococcus gallinarum]